MSITFSVYAGPVIKIAATSEPMVKRMMRESDTEDFFVPPDQHLYKDTGRALFLLPNKKAMTPRECTYNGYRDPEVYVISSMAEDIEYFRMNTLHERRFLAESDIRYEIVWAIISYYL